MVLLGSILNRHLAELSCKVWRALALVPGTALSPVYTWQVAHHWKGNIHKNTLVSPRSHANTQLPGPFRNICSNTSGLIFLSLFNTSVNNHPWVCKHDTMKEWGKLSVLFNRNHTASELNRTWRREKRKVVMGLDESEPTFVNVCHQLFQVYFWVSYYDDAPPPDKGVH